MHDFSGAHDHKVHSPEETLALLTYMIDHNRHHAEELHELAHSASEEAAAMIHDAVDAFTSGNELLEKALCLLRQECPAADGSGTDT